MEDFKAWLSRAWGHGPSTVHTYGRYVALFLAYLEQEGLEVGEVTYAVLLAYIRAGRRQGLSRGVLNRWLGAIRYYYTYLEETGRGQGNPAAGLYLPGRSVREPVGLLDRAALDQLYADFPVYDLRSHRNQVMLGLLVFQGLAREEIQALRPGDVDTEGGWISVPASRKRNGRKLRLETRQVLSLDRYLRETRPAIRGQFSHRRPGRQPARVDWGAVKAQLFFSMGGSGCLKNSLMHLLRAVRRLCPEVRNASQLRQSVIRAWLQQYDVRQVQYWAGHRYVSSTERYENQAFEALQKRLEGLHPLSGEG